MNCKRVMLFSMAIILLSCTKEKPLSIIFSVDGTVESFAPVGGSKNIYIASNVFWQAFSNQDWLSVSPENGTEESTITLTATPNNMSSAREAVVSLIPDKGNTIDILITQQALMFSLDTTAFVIDDNPTKKTVRLKSNIPWSATTSEKWLKVISEEGVGGEEELTIAIDRNRFMQSRTGSVVLLPSHGEAIEIILSQQAASYSSTITRFVAAEPLGNGRGDSQEDAADFLDIGFWTRVNSKLQSVSVEVLFLPGDYSRACTGTNIEGFALDRLGNETNRLTLTGGHDVIFKIPEGYSTKSNLIRFHGSQNITFRDFNFTGDGSVNYVLAIRSPEGFPPSKNILIENCTWLDMRGTIIGGTGCHFKGTTNITYKNCTFKRIGLETRATHIMYHAYGAENIKVIDCYFEDGMGEYIRFRDRTDYGMVRNCTFNRSKGWNAVAFIAIPNYNNVDPGNEYFGTNYSFTGNVFQNNSNAIQFRHTGFSPKEYNYLLTAEEGVVLEKGEREDKIKLLNENCGLDISKIRINNNDFSSIFDMKISFSSNVMYGAVSLGWTGTVDITDLFDGTLPPFNWETE